MDEIAMHDGTTHHTRDAEAAALMLLVATAGAVSSVSPNPTLGFITQMWVLGSILGTVIALVRYRRDPDNAQWALCIGAGSVAGAVLGLLIAAVDALPI